MVSSARQAFACVLFILLAAAPSPSQTTSAKNATSSISGKVTLKGKGLPRVTVIAREPTAGRFDRTGYRATTDATGNYRIANLPAGNYEVRPVGLALVLENDPSRNTVVVGEAEDLDEVNFSLVRGGVITGKVTDADGRPVIEERVNFLPVMDMTSNFVFSGNTIQTDDRGVYRAYGLPQAKYKVWVGQAEYMLPSGRPAYKETYYPSVTDAEKATLVEVTEGSESADINITLGRPVTGYTVTGRIVDAETGRPLPNVKYGVVRINEHGSESTSGLSGSNARGEFRMENVLPGDYSLFVRPEGDSGLRGESVSFEVVDRDVSEILIKAFKGASVSGVLVLEGGEDAAAVTKLSGLFIDAWVLSSETHFDSISNALVKPDGSFKLAGLRSGMTQFALSPAMRPSPKPIALVRIERDGVVQPARGMNVRDGEQITGVRLVAKYLTGSIRGQVRVEEGELPAGSRLSVWLNLLEQERAAYKISAGNTQPQVDSRGRFVVEGLAAGAYEVYVAVFEPGRQDSMRVFKEQVTVADNAVSDVTVTVKLNRPE